MEASDVTIENLVENFLTAVLCLTLESRIHDLSQLADAHLRKINDPPKAHGFALPGKQVA